MKDFDFEAEPSCQVLNKKMALLFVLTLLLPLAAMKAYHIKDWDTLYETNSTRTVETLSYFAKRNKLVGECLGYMLAQPDGRALYGTWTFIEILASSAPKPWRGWLVRNGTPLDALRMSALTRIPVEEIQRVLDFCSTPPMDWLEHIEWPAKKAAPSDARQPADSPPSDARQPADGISARRRSEKKTEEEERDNNKGSLEQSKVQFAALAARVASLKGIPEPDRTDEQQDELVEGLRRLREIQKKQAAGDFSPASS